MFMSDFFFFFPLLNDQFIVSYLLCYNDYACAFVNAVQVYTCHNK